MRIVSRVAVLVFAIIGALNGIVINTLVSLYKTTDHLLGGTAGRGYGLLGGALIVIAVLGALVALRNPLIGGILLLLCGIGFIFVVHWWAILVVPAWITGGALAIAENYDAAADRIQRTGHRLGSGSGTPALPSS